MTDVADDVVWADDEKVQRRVRVRRKPGQVTRAVPGLPAPRAAEPMTLIGMADETPRDVWRQRARRGWLGLLVVNVLVLLLAGIGAAWQWLAGGPNTSTAPATQSASDRSPDPAAEAYALRVARLWFTYSPSTRTERRQAVAELLPGATPDIGWDGTSTSSTSDAWVVSDTPVVPDLVTGQVRRVAVLVVANGTERTLLLTIGRDGRGAPYLVQWPTLGSAPRVGDVRSDVDQVDQVDLAGQRLATPTVEGFLRAWGAGTSDLPVFVLEGWNPPPGPGNLRFVKADWQLPVGIGQYRTVNALVTWEDTDKRQLQSAYSLTLSTTGTRWSVAGFDVAQPGAISLTTNS